jgi:hypothetical protein
MRYLQHKEIKRYREENKPKRCPIFEVKLDDSVLDHCHNHYHVRGVIDNFANQFLGKIENAWKRYGGRSKLTLQEALLNTIDYLNDTKTDILHPVGFRQMVTRFKSLTSRQQRKELLEMGVDSDTINTLKNQSQRISQYKLTIKQKCNQYYT